MNAERNGSEDSSREVELTSLALGQLDKRQSRDVERRIGDDAAAQRVVRETQQLATLISQSADRGLPADVAGLTRQIEMAFDEQAEIAGDDKVMAKSNRRGRLSRTNIMRRRLLAWGGVAALVAGFALVIWPNVYNVRQGAFHDTSDRVIADGAVDRLNRNAIAEPGIQGGQGFLPTPAPVPDHQSTTPFGRTGASHNQHAQPTPTGQSSGDAPSTARSDELGVLANLRVAPTMENGKSESGARSIEIYSLGLEFHNGQFPLKELQENYGIEKYAMFGDYLVEGNVKLPYSSAGSKIESKIAELTDLTSPPATGTRLRRPAADRGDEDQRRGRFEFRGQRSPRNTEQYEQPPENPFVPASGTQARSTFAIDVDTASYANLRRFINQGQLPPPAAVRIEEMINYFAYDYPQPQGNAPFSVNMEVAGCPWNPSHQLLRIGIKGKEIHRDERPASNLVFLLDVSGSMKDANKLPLLKRAMLMLVDRLTENDRVSIVTYAGSAGTQLESTSGDQKQKIRQVIESLSSGGSTHGSAGIQMAYDLASSHFIEGGVNRVILATDGDLNVGITRDDALVRLIKDRAHSGVFLSVLGFGTGNLKDAKLEKLADNGNGNYSYIDSIREAQKVLIEQMSESLVTIAKDVKIQVEFNPAEVRGYRLIGYENRRLANRDFDNNAVDAGEIGAGHTVTALYELIPADTLGSSEAMLAEDLKYQKRAEQVQRQAGAALTDAALTDAAKSGEVVTVALRYKEPDGVESERIEFVVENSKTAFDDASADFRFAASVASLGMILRRSRYAGESSLDLIEQMAAAAIGDDTHGHRSEFVDLVRQVATMSR